MWTIYKKELKMYFLSPIGYVAIGLFLAMYSVFFFLTTIQYGAVDLGNLYYATARYGLLLIVPILTMRMFAEERKSGTEQLLLTSPRSIISIVMGKFLAAVTIVLITLIISIMYFVIVSFFGNANLVTVLVTMLGFLLLAMAAISFGKSDNCRNNNNCFFSNAMVFTRFKFCIFTSKLNRKIYKIPICTNICI